MLFRSEVLAGIARGAVTLAFRRWLRPGVREHSTLLTQAGQLEIRSVTRIAASAISDEDARRAGYDSRAALLAELKRRDAGDLYRIELGALRPDPRVALRASIAAEPGELGELVQRLARLDARTASGPWTRRTLELIEAQPEVRAALLCKRVGQELPAFKLNVRKLKALGLTQSLDVGYRLSPRGAALLAVLRAGP